jgi:hypothetical protein
VHFLHASMMPFYAHETLRANVGKVIVLWQPSAFPGVTSASYASHFLMLPAITLVEIPYPRQAR